jgi:cytochrome c biogenesis protein CcdA
MVTTFPILTAFVLGLLTILDPCTLFTSITAISYIDKEIANKRRVINNGILFVLGKLVTYVLLSIPFIAGAQTDKIQHILEHYGEPILAIFMLICGILLLYAGHHHHTHDHGISKWLQDIDGKNSSFWSFMLGIFFAIAFCPHRLVYFFTMIDIAINIPAIWNWMLPIVFGLGTGLPIMVIAWLISYSAVSISTLTKRLHSIEKWIRYISAVLFIGYGIYLCVHIFAHEDGCSCNHHHSTCVTSSRH